MPNITVYLDEEQYLLWIKIEKDKRKEFLGWALGTYLKAETNDKPENSG